jgi:long-chain acyl-CoA synthetase
MTVPAKILIGRNLANAAHRHADRTVYRFEDRSFTFTEHLAIAGGIVDRLTSQFGVKPGDRVAILANSSQAYVACWHAAMLGHFVIVPVNVRLAPLEIAGLIENAGVEVLVHDRSLAEAAGEISELAAAGLRSVDLAAIAEPGAPLELLDTAGEEDLVAIMYTGGTTGRPKGVVMTQKALSVTHHRLHLIWDIFPVETVFYGTAALFHISGSNIYMGPVLAGNLTVLPASFDIDRLVRDVKEQKVTHIILIAAMIDRFLDAIRDGAEDYAHLKYIGYGGAPVAAATLSQLTRLLPGTRIQQSYGMTEILGGITLLRTEDHDPARGKLASAGRALPGCDMEARRADNSRCAAGETGEIVIRIDSFMAGYWQQPEQTAAVFDDGWYRTGDVGYVDDEGYLFLVDRLKDMIVTGGENVYSLEVERAIETAPGVRHACVIGVPSQAWGEQVHAFVVLDPGCELDEDALRAHLRTRIGGYKIPKSFDIGTAPLPMTPNNKVDKASLRARFWKDAERMIN